MGMVDDATRKAALQKLSGSLGMDADENVHVPEFIASVQQLSQHCHNTATITPTLFRKAACALINIS